MVKLERDRFDLFLWPSNSHSKDCGWRRTFYLETSLGLLNFELREASKLKLIFNFKRLKVFEKSSFDSRYSNYLQNVSAFIQCLFFVGPNWSVFFLINSLNLGKSCSLELDWRLCTLQQNTSRKRAIKFNAISKLLLLLLFRIN